MTQTQTEQDTPETVRRIIFTVAAVPIGRCLRGSDSPSAWRSTRCRS